jgi:hypothetical protein
MKILEKLNTNLPETELCSLGLKYKTDKFNHGYTKVYYEIMKNFRHDYVNIFEIGIYIGSSIKMWYEFFHNGKIYGIDNGRLIPGSKVIIGKSTSTPSIDDFKLLQFENIIENLKYSWLENDRVKCFTADQRSEEQLKKAFEYFKCDAFDIILDDGQHYQEHQQRSLGILFPFVKSGGYYIIEDVITYQSLLDNNYWGQYKSDASDSTDYIFTNFLKTGKLESIYMLSEQIKYILNNIEDIFLYDELNKNNSPINLTSKLLIIKKK